jgi:hypothetical protein
MGQDGLCGRGTLAHLPDLAEEAQKGASPARFDRPGQRRGQRRGWVGRQSDSDFRLGAVDDDAPGPEARRPDLEDSAITQRYLHDDRGSRELAS